MEKSEVVFESILEELKEIKKILENMKKDTDLMTYIEEGISSISHSSQHPAGK